VALILLLVTGELEIQMAKIDRQEAEEEQPAGNKKKLIIIIVSVLLLAGISTGAMLMFLGGDEEPVDAVAGEEKKPVKGDPAYFELKPFTVNLGPEDPVAYVQIQIQVLSYYSEVSADLEKHTPLIRNNLSLLFGQQKSADLRSPEGKLALQKKVHEQIQGIIKKYGSGGEVDGVFFTNFVMQ
jgi:flagellar FliL protein